MVQGQQVLAAALTSAIFAASPGAVAATPPAAVDPGLPGEHVRELPVSYVVDGAVTLGAALAWVSTDSIFFTQLAPARCRWCDRAADGTDKLNGLDAWARGVRWGLSAQGAANGLSSVIDFAVLPVAMVALDAYLARPNFRAWLPGDLLIVFESAMLATLVDQMIKFAAARQRPYAHFGSADQAPAPLNRDDNLSFFSGHATLAFAMVVGVGTVARLRGYRWAWLVWAIGLPLATSVAYLRMAADVHYLTDVMVGSAVGALVGFSAPTLFHSPREAAVRIDVIPAPNGASVRVTF